MRIVHCTRVPPLGTGVQVGYIVNLCITQKAAGRRKQGVLGEGLLGCAGSLTRHDIKEGCGSGGWRCMGVFGSGLKGMWSVTVGLKDSGGVVRG